ncbi:hypothetical protein [Azovibrio restrictus]|jgi:MSHA biogenesis protein MshP|uniref:hypothetical protein n=1 Tax=Azovibrio restrictus TaxID=146938 RepID=UPI0026EF72EC|nr:hypothetical protein [Azovibrio restrictus]
MRRRERGFGAIAAILVLVILGGLAAAIVSFSSGQQVASAQDIQSTRAWLAAYAGTEWGLARALQANDCSTNTWTHPDYVDMRVTVACTGQIYNEGETGPGVERRIRVFRVVATACNGTGACPDATAVTNLLYVERQRVAVAYCELDPAGNCLP